MVLRVEDKLDDVVIVEKYGIHFSLLLIILFHISSKDNGASRYMTTQNKNKKEAIVRRRKI